MTYDETISEIIEKLEEKKIEANRFSKKYNDRNMTDLEEYYKGAEWALEWALKKIKDILETEQKPQ